jgi:hypothetical protein
MSMGHGHVNPRPDGVKARCGGPHMCPECARELAAAGSGALTGLRLYEGENWDVFPDLMPPEYPDFEGIPAFARTVPHRSGADLPVARLRRIGWVDQKGRVYTSVPPQAGFDGGSLTPLLIDPGERDGS